ncbi:hypothetical protein JHK85_005307 [Glycine max]|nr:hypothetical protein JHK87_004971 [Glycine soja]KAG5064124.1 hypothetical protein JHK85_005307 [Glycine max]KAG5081073.1 hypothetical protein JHK86_005138 [Glycine max]
MAKTRRILHLVVRFVAFAATFCAAIIMAASHERDFNHGTHLKLLCSIAIAMVGPRGNSYWKPICGSIPNYCDKVTGAFAADLIAVVIYVKLLQLI